MIKRKYFVKGFDCPGCANSAIEKLKRNENILDASLDFFSSLLTISYKKDSMINDELAKLLTRLSGDKIFISDWKEKEVEKKTFTFKMIVDILRIIISLVLVLFARFLFSRNSLNNFDINWWSSIIFYGVAYILVSYEFYFSVFKNIPHPSTFLNEKFLMVAASIGCIVLFDYFEAVMVLLLGLLGEIIEDISIERSKKILSRTIDKRSPKTHKIVNDVVEDIDSSSIKINDHLLIKVGEALPTDGIVIKGSGTLDVSSITGEFIPVDIADSMPVYSGSILTSGSLTIKATTLFHNSTTSKILQMCLDNAEHKSKAEKFITKFAKWYTPLVVLLAVLFTVIPPLISLMIHGTTTGDIWLNYFHRSLSFLVIACPCAIIISVPLCYSAAITLASKHGVIIKGADLLEELANVKTVLTDKTGTLTTGDFTISSYHLLGIDKSEFNKILYSGESYSSHPLGKSIIKCLPEINSSLKVSDFKELSGYGIEFKSGSSSYVIGNRKLLISKNIALPDNESNLLSIYVSKDNVCLGYVLLDDKPKENVANFIKELDNRGIKIVMLSGANEESTKNLASHLNIKEYKHDLMPEDKVSILKQEKEKLDKKSRLAFVGDGVNDSPSLAISDVGISMGALGSDEAISNSDAMIMNDDLLKIVDAFEISKLARKRAIICIAFSLLVKFTFLILSAFNLVNMSIVHLSDTGLMVVVVIYALLLLCKKKLVNH